MSLESSAAASLSSTEEILTFEVGGQSFAVDIRHVQEIREYERPTGVPGSGPAVLGVMLLRNRAVSVFDMGQLLLGAPVQRTPQSVYIVMNLPGTVVAFLVDAVSSVIGLKDVKLHEVPLGARNSHCVQALAAYEGEMSAILRVDTLLSRAASAPGGEATVPELIGTQHVAEEEAA